MRCALLLVFAAGLAQAAPRAADVTLHDPARGKDLEVRVTLPDDSGPHPVILWSHGAFGSARNYRPLAEHWAARGYVVVQPTHSDSLMLAARQGRVQELQRSAFGDWRSRPADITFLLDSAAALEAAVPGLAARWDPNTVGLGGHSYGAQTTMLLGGVTTAGGSFTDPRPKALVMISAQGPGPLMGQLRWEDASRPQLHVTGSEDSSDRTGEGPEWRLEAYRRSTAARRFLLYIEGADHAFGGIGGRRRGVTPNADHVGAVRAVTTAFWDATLKGSAKARRFLRDDVVSGWTRGAAHVYDAGDPLPEDLPRYSP